MKQMPEVIIGALLATAAWSIIAMFSQGKVSDLKDVAGPAATIFASAAAGIVAYMIGRSQIAVAEKNWQTANEKIVLDLFDKRLGILEQMRSAIGEVMRSGHCTDLTLYNFDVATDRLPYFFGEEIQKYVRGIRNAMIDLELANKMMENQLDPERPKWIQRRHDLWIKVVAWYEESPRLFAAYLKAHQKA
ncbi:hypothetical protein M2212_007109 [Bradyrhizobium elkanii]|uniref:hypothetical protein n=1 Tax=Bradyrhizobium elkanii TaxID=29448 RepID=UPI002169B822|nr:hypothetical protein [Bradyrhizobium elkanii]MCS3480263.1 hypothetical protein [Bradyrhizobium elkanii]